MRVQTSRATAKRIKIERWLADPLAPGIRCENPFRVMIDGRPDPARFATGLDPDRAVFTEVDAPCRRCSTCLEIRKNRWAARGAAEFNQSVRTWFGTLTFEPSQRLRIEALSRRKALTRGLGVWETLDQSDRFRLLAAECAPIVTRYIKRVRKEAACRLRYCAVVEAHKDGFPHYHVLLHELDAPVRKRTLDGQWEVGFSQWRLASDIRAVFYAAKYLAKSSDARVRASLGYGRAREGATLAAAAQAATQPLPGVVTCDSRRGEPPATLRPQTCNDKGKEICQ